MNSSTNSNYCFIKWMWSANTFMELDLAYRSLSSIYCFDQSFASVFISCHYMMTVVGSSIPSVIEFDWIRASLGRLGSPEYSADWNLGF